MAFSYAASRLARNLRLSYLRALVSQDVAYIENHTSGAVAADIFDEASKIQSGFSETLGLAIQAISTVVTSFIVAFTQSWRLTLATGTSIVVLFIFLWLLQRIQAQLGTLITSISSQSASLTEEALSGIAEVIALNAKSKLLRKYERFLEQKKNATIRYWPTFGAELGFTYFSLLSAYALAFCVILSINQATAALLQLLPSWAQVTKARIATKRFHAVMTREPLNDPFDTSGLQPTNCNGRIELQGVHFTYPSRPDVQVLTDLTLAIESGKTTALIGPSGSGKTSVVGLIERWYQCSSGKILLDGMSTDELNLRWMRSQIGLVQQEPLLFEGTIMQNVAHGLYGTPSDYSGTQAQELVRQACVDANIDDFIRQLPLGYQTMVGDRGSQLSGGQKQRIAIARAIVARPRILILDEATAALDPEGEALVQGALDRVSKNRTTVVIAHKLSTIKNADRIVLLSDGRAVEEGSHADLLDRDGAYARLVRAQDLHRQFSYDDDMSLLEPLQKPQNAPTDMIHAYEDKEANMEPLEPKIPPSQSQQQRKLSLTGCLWVIFNEHKPMRGLLVLGILTFALLGTLTLRHYRAEYFATLLSQNLGFFDDKWNSPGVLTGRLVAQTNQLEAFLSSTLGPMVQIIVNLASCWIISLVVAWKISLVAIFGSLPVIFASGWLRIKIVAKIQQRNIAQYDEPARLASEAIGAIKTVSSLCMEKQICTRFADALSGPMARARRSLLPNMALFALTQSAKLLGTALIF
ncbi:MAG: hypothetical protein Q9165_003665 [Trypethelium subeluteriae]